MKNKHREREKRSDVIEFAYINSFNTFLQKTWLHCDNRDSNSTTNL